MKNVMKMFKKSKSYNKLIKYYFIERFMFMTNSKVINKTIQNRLIILSYLSDAYFVAIFNDSSF